MQRVRAAATAAALLLAALAPAATGAARPFPNIPYATWSDDEPLYRLYPGDDIEVGFPTAPELNKTVTVQPDGRITLPLVDPQMAAGRSAPELRDELEAAYASQLLRPEVTVSLKALPLKVFVGGEVGKPGVYDMPGDLDSLRAIMEAGGFLDGARKSQVIIIRRARDGRPMMRTVNLDRALHGGTDLVPLRRFDIVYVPKTGLAELASFMTQVRNALPIQFSYAFGSVAGF
ncbi:MAG TPA: polysaccharide biosynthesis/export family protein [Caulobacteraceae bacterium]|jgi:polysaccharide export outer membrane protein